MDAITTYATLQAAVAGMEHRSGNAQFEANLPLFIQLAEVDLYDRLFLRDMETEEPLTLTQDQNYVALPVGYISPVTLWLVVDSQRRELVKLLPEDLRYSTESGIPNYWAVDGENIRFDCPSKDAYLAPFRFLKKSALSDANPTNYLLERRPDVYLYGASKQAALFTQDDAALSKYATLYEAALRSLANTENRSRRTTLRTDMPGIYGRSNILTG